MSDPSDGGGSWTLLTGHGHVLVEIARNPDARIRDISAVAGLTERSTQAIVADLEAAGYLTRTRTGRRVRYTVNRDSLFRHSAQEGHRVGPLLDLLAAPEAGAGEPGGGVAAGLPVLGKVAVESGDADHDQAGVIGGVGDGAGQDPVGLGGGGQPPASPAL